MVEPIYQPRKPKLSPLYQSIVSHFSEFESVYQERYQKRCGVLRDVVREVVYKYLGCGDLRKGFARIKCKGCNHEVLLAFSCKGRYFCPSCHQKRVLIFGEWITEEILYPLPHRQYVFTVPKMLRPHFRFDRKLLGKLSRCAYDCLKEFFRKTLDKKEGVPGVVISIQTFGDLVNFHPHLHCLVSDGCFMSNSRFYVLPPSPFSQEKMTYQKETKTVIYRSKMNPILKKNFAVFPVLDWILAITAHIPNKGEQLVRYYGYYSNVSLIPLPVPSARGRCGSSASSISQM